MRALYTAARDADEEPPKAALAGLVVALDALPGLDPRDRAIVRYVARLTVRPRSMRAHHVAELRAAGLDDRAIHDVVEVACCFAFMNRLADGTGVTVEPSRHAFARELLGPLLLDEHLAWARGNGSSRSRE